MMPSRFVVFGGLGDLTLRYLLPAVGELHSAGRLPDGLEIVAAARDDEDTESYRRIASERLGDVPPSAREAVIGMLSYVQADASIPDEVRDAMRPQDGPAVAYLALPPAVFAPAIEALAEAGLAEGSRIVVEKPFGEDLDSARRLNELLHHTFTEDDVFRIDHFLGMQTVQNILGLRFGNRIFEPLWSAEHIEAVEIVWEETLTLEGRASYYDSAGAMRDMIQNHLLQVLCMVAMESPAELDPRELRDAKVELLRAVASPDPDGAAQVSRRARYGAGRIGKRKVPAYPEEEGVDPDRGTETFAELTLTVDNRRWAGVPFTVRTGKALGRDRFEALIRFHDVADPGFCEEQARLRPNVLRLGLDPERVEMDVNVNGPGDAFSLSPAALSLDLTPAELSAYAQILLDVLDGEATLSIRDDEAEESWRIVDPILEAWAEDKVPLEEYPAGSEGPGRDG